MPSDYAVYNTAALRVQYNGKKKSIYQIELFCVTVPSVLKARAVIDVA